MSSTATIIRDALTRSLQEQSPSARPLTPTKKLYETRCGYCYYAKHSWQIRFKSYGFVAATESVGVLGGEPATQNKTQCLGTLVHDGNTGSDDPPLALVISILKRAELRNIFQLALEAVERKTTTRFLKLVVKLRDDDSQVDFAPFLTKILGVKRLRKFRTLEVMNCALAVLKSTKLFGVTEHNGWKINSSTEEIEDGEYARVLKDVIEFVQDCLVDGVSDGGGEADQMPVAAVEPLTLENQQVAGAATGETPRSVDQSPPRGRLHFSSLLSGSQNSTPAKKSRPSRASTPKTPPSILETMGQRVEKSTPRSNTRNSPKKSERKKRTSKSPQTPSSVLEMTPQRTRTPSSSVLERINVDICAETSSASGDGDQVHIADEGCDEQIATTEAPDIKKLDHRLKAQLASAEEDEAAKERELSLTDVAKLQIATKPRGTVDASAAKEPAVANVESSEKATVSKAKSIAAEQAESKEANKEDLLESESQEGGQRDSPEMKPNHTAHNEDSVEAKEPDADIEMETKRNGALVVTCGAESGAEEVENSMPSDSDIGKSKADEKEDATTARPRLSKRNGRRTESTEKMASVDAEEIVVEQPRHSEAGPKTKSAGLPIAGQKDAPEKVHREVTFLDQVANEAKQAGSTDVLSKPSGTVDAAITRSKESLSDANVVDDEKKFDEYDINHESHHDLKIDVAIDSSDAQVATPSDAAEVLALTAADSFDVHDLVKHVEPIQGGLSSEDPPTPTTDPDPRYDSSAGVATAKATSSTAQKAKEDKAVVVATHGTPRETKADTSTPVTTLVVTPDADGEKTSSPTEIVGTSSAVTKSRNDTTEGTNTPVFATASSVKTKKSVGSDTPLPTQAVSPSDTVPFSTASASNKGKRMDVATSDVIVDVAPEVKKCKTDTASTSTIVSEADGSKEDCAPTPIFAPNKTARATDDRATALNKKQQRKEALKQGSKRAKRKRPVSTPTIKEDTPQTGQSSANEEADKEVVPTKRASKRSKGGIKQNYGAKNRAAKADLPIRRSQRQPKMSAEMRGKGRNLPQRKVEVLEVDSEIEEEIEDEVEEEEVDDEVDEESIVEEEVPLHWDKLNHKMIIMDYVYSGNDSLPFGETTESALKAVEEELEKVGVIETQEYLEEERIYKSSMAYRGRMANAEKASRQKEKIQHDEAVKATMKVRPVKKTPEQVVYDSFVNKKGVIVYAGSKGKASKLTDCCSDKACRLCIVPADAPTMATKANIPAPACRLSTVTDSWREYSVVDEEPELTGKKTKGSAPPNKRNNRRRSHRSSNKTGLMLVEMKHTLQFLDGHNRGYMT
jgi:hypothetical protein